MDIEDSRKLTTSVQEELERILNSDTFRASERLSCFLRVVVERTLQGSTDQLKEYFIGVEVMHRKPSFDPRMDPIVRVEAGRLRSRLRQYYETEGASAPLRIELPKGGYVPTFEPRDREERGEQTTAASDTRALASSIAVLPFADHSREKDQAYFCEGMTEEVINALTRVPALRVIAWPSAHQFKSQGAEPHNLAELNIGSVLEGSIRKADDRLRITAHLISASDNRYLWAETYDRKFEDVFAIQEEIASAIVDALRVRLETEAASPLVRPSTADVNAYNLYLKGRYYWNRRSPAGMEKSIEYFRLAIQKDPQYALAHAGLADAYSLLANYGAAVPLEAREAAKQAALNAVAIDNSLAEAHCSLAHVRATYDWDWDGAEHEFELAINLNPRYPTAHHWYSITVLAPLGQIEQALAEIHRARELDPISLSINRDVAVIYFFQRRYAAAIEQSKHCIALDPTFGGAYWTLGMAYEQEAEFEKAIEAFQSALKLSDRMPRMLGALGHAYGASGDHPKAKDILDRLESLSDHRFVSPFESALVYLGLGDIDRAFSWLEKAFKIRAYELVSLRTDPRYDPLRADPRFLALIEKVGLLVT